MTCSLSLFLQPQKWAKCFRLKNVCVYFKCKSFLPSEIDPAFLREILPDAPFEEVLLTCCCDFSELVWEPSFSFKSNSFARILLRYSCFQKYGEDDILALTENAVQ